MENLEMFYSTDCIVLLVNAANVYYCYFFHGEVWRTCFAKLLDISILLHDSNTTSFTQVWARERNHIYKTWKEYRTIVYMISYLLMFPIKFVGIYKVTFTHFLRIIADIFKFLVRPLSLRCTRSTLNFAHLFSHRLHHKFVHWLYIEVPFPSYLNKIAT